MKEDEEAVKRIKGEALKEKEDPGAFIFPIRLEEKVNKNALVDIGSDINTMPYRIFETLGREDMKKVDRGITMIDHTQAEAMGKLSNVLCQLGVTTIIAKFLIIDIPIDRDAPEEYVIKRNKFGAPIYGPIPAPYLNCANPEDRSLAIQEVTNPFRKISVWKKAASFLGSFPVPLKQVNWKPDYKGSYTKEEEVTGQWVREAKSEEEIFTSVAWIRAFNINEPIYAKLCHEFYSTYEFDEVCADDELQSKKIIRRFAIEIIKFYDDLDEHIRREENLGLSRSHTSIIRNPNLRMIHKMITYGLCQRTTGYDKVQKNDLWHLSMFDARHQNEYANVAWFISKLARKCRVLTEDVVRSLSAPIYCRDLDTAILSDLINSDGKVIPEDP
ncbi:retrotransposon ORF1 [Tanacetum coccineum]